MHEPNRYVLKPTAHVHGLFLKEGLTKDQCVPLNGNFNMVVQFRFDNIHIGLIQAICFFESKLNMVGQFEYDKKANCTIVVQ